MTTTEGPIREQVQAKVLFAGSDTKRENLIKLEIPAFQVGAEKPMEIGFVPAEEIAKVKPGQWYTVLLQRGKLKTNPTTKKALPGTRPTHYFYDVVSISDPIPEGLPTGRVKGEEAEAQFEEREHRIMRATALAQAVAFLGQGGHTPDEALEVAGVFYAWLRDGPQVAPSAISGQAQKAQDGASAPAVADSSPGGAERPVAKVAAAPSGGVVGGGGVAGPKEELFPEGPVWPMVELEERAAPITPDDWAKIGEIVKGRGVERATFNQWVRSKWGLRPAEKLRRGDLIGMVDWLREQGGGTGR